MEIDGRALTLAFIGLLVVASLTTFIIFDGLQNLRPDERELPHDYEVTGTLSGVICSGEGRSEYTDVTTVDRIYEFRFDLVSGDIHRSLKFGFAFGQDDRPLESLYTYAGTSVHCDRIFEVWTYSEDGVDYTFLVGDLCTVHQVTILSQDLCITGHITSEES